MSDSFIVNKAAILGAGVMGAQIAAHFCNAQIPVLLFDLPSTEDNKNQIAQQGIDRLKKLDPQPLAIESRVNYIEPLNYETDLARLSECDLIIEAVAERMDIKLGLFEKIAPHIHPKAVLASNTSGLSINQLSHRLPENLRPRFCGIHFFNPPRYMYLVELIANETTPKELLDQLESFLTTRLGKGVIRAKDTSNFIANRIGVFSILATLHHASTFQIPFEVVDQLTGTKIGRPKSATFRTADVVGLDTLAHVVKTMADTLPDDPWHAYFQLPAWFDTLIKNGALGQKTQKGIYQKVGKEIKVLDPSSGEYRGSDREASSAILEILKDRNLKTRFQRLKEDTSPEAKFLWAIHRDLFHYCAFHLADVADNARDLDLAVRWGFGWKKGPFEQWQSAGWHAIADAMQLEIDSGKTLANVRLPEWVMAPQREGVHSAEGSYAPPKNAYVPRPYLPVYRRQLYPDPMVGESVVYGETVYENSGVRLWHTGDDLPVLSFKTKMHVVGDEVLDGILQAIEIAENKFQGLIVWQPEAPFSAGANLLQVMQGLNAPVGSSLWNKARAMIQRMKFTIGGKGNMSKVIDAITGQGPKVADVIAKFQLATGRLRYSRIPTVAAVQGLALGGGCEIVMHCDRAVAALETYIGLVEAGVGVLPAGGGSKEFAIRAWQDSKGQNIFPFLQRYYQLSATATIAKSAEQAKEMGFLRPSDIVVMNPFELLYVAKAQAKGLADAGYRQPLPETKIPVVGRMGIGNIEAFLVNMIEGHQISEHDFVIAMKIANVMCGGDVDPGTLVDEEWLLELERKGFLELLAMPKTQARIEYMLKTGKPLRN